ncbi:hypothetical protein MPL3365_200109 [Mesorhizobium plurifarium]|uniref:Uncharacterized protein n=1 Tax=Mesorhizobium plurifarium TaxID=69974 RepID=A0A090G2Y0_MESPL|nr:hypothetical protein MPL3365_200109 [Mesorhizobium plurifarium]
MPDETGKPAKRRLNRSEKRALRAARVQLFAKQYGRKAQRNTEPNDRRYDREIEAEIKRMRPDTLDTLIRDEEV